MSSFRRPVLRGDMFYFSNAPVTGSEQRGGRPGIVVSNDMNNKHSNIVSIVYTTSQNKPYIPEHVPIDSLPKPGIVLCEQIHTVSTSRMKGYKGRANQDEMNRINKALIDSLGIPIESLIEYVIEREGINALKDYERRYMNG